MRGALLVALAGDVLMATSAAAVVARIDETARRRAFSYFLLRPWDALTTITSGFPPQAAFGSQAPEPLGGSVPFDWGAFDETGSQQGSLV